MYFSKNTVNSDSWVSTALACVSADLRRRNMCPGDSEAYLLLLHQAAHNHNSISRGSDTLFLPPHAHMWIQTYISVFFLNLLKETKQGGEKGGGGGNMRRGEGNCGWYLKLMNWLIKKEKTKKNKRLNKNLHRRASFNFESCNLFQRTFLHTWFEKLHNTRQEQHTNLVPAQHEHSSQRFLFTSS